MRDEACHLATEASLLAHPIPHYLVDRFRAWRSARYADSRAWYARLMAEGQRPRAMLIACCDSRLDTVAMFGAEPGDLFVVRNVANLIPPYAPDGAKHGTSAAVEYAVGTLKVAHIVVVGHSRCGGVEACHDMCSGRAPALEEESSFIGRWMDILRPGFERVKPSGDRVKDLKALEEQAVRVSLENLASFPFVKEAAEKGLLTLHGAWIDIAEGEIYGLDPASDAFRKL